MRSVLSQYRSLTGRKAPNMDDHPALEEGGMS